jgi:hypothetical protein
MKKHRNRELKRQEKESCFAAFQFTAAFTFSQLLEFPYNFLMVLIPLLAFEGVLIVFYLRKLNRKNQPINLAPKETQGLLTPKPKPKVQGIPATKIEISNDSVKFSVEKGFFKKRWVTVKEIPVAEITAIEVLRNELSVTWKGVTDVFVLNKKGESFSKLRDQIQGLIDEHQKTLENNTKAQQRKSDLAQVIEGSIGVVDLSFNILMSLQVKHVSWEDLEAYGNELGENCTFAGQTLAPLSLDFSKVSEAIKSQVPEEVSQEIFNLLRSIYGYFAELSLEEDLQEAHPNFRDAKASILAYYTLNDLLLGKIVGEKTNKKEGLVLEGALQNLAKETNFNVNFEDLRGSFDRMSSVDDVKSVIEETREIFKEQLKNIDCPNGQLLTAQPQTLEPVFEQLQAMQSPIEPTANVQTESIEPSKPIEPLQPPKPQELTVQPSIESPVIEQLEAVEPSTEQTDEPSVQLQEPVPADFALPESKDTKNIVELPPKKKSAGRRLRKSILGY